MPAYRDPFSGRHYPGPSALVAAVARDHGGQLGAMGVTAAQLVYNHRNRLPLGTTHGRSVSSGRPTAWCERAGRYERFHDDAERAAYRAGFLARMHAHHGKDHLLDDPEHQRGMLAARSISGTYAFADGSSRTYTGSYERELLEFLDAGLGWPGADVQCPAPQNFSYEDAAGRRRWYLPDAYLESLNLIVEVKPDMDNAAGWRNRDIEIERAKDAVLGTSGYNYVKVVGRDYGDLVDAIAAARAGSESGA